MPVPIVSAFSTIAPAEGSPRNPAIPPWIGATLPTTRSKNSPAPGKPPAKVEYNRLNGVQRQVKRFPSRQKA